MRRGRAWLCGTRCHVAGGLAVAMIGATESGKASLLRKTGCWHSTRRSCCEIPADGNKRDSSVANYGVMAMNPVPGAAITPFFATRDAFELPSPRFTQRVWGRVRLCYRSSISPRPFRGIHLRKARAVLRAGPLAPRSTARAGRGLRDLRQAGHVAVSLRIHKCNDLRFCLQMSCIACSGSGILHTIVI